MMESVVTYRKNQYAAGVVESPSKCEKGLEGRWNFVQANYSRETQLNARPSRFWTVRWREVILFAGIQDRCPLPLYKGVHPKGVMAISFIKEMAGT